MALPERIAALPDYVASSSVQPFVDAAPGHRFLLYFRSWQGQGSAPFVVYKGKVRVSQGLTRDQKKIEEDHLKQHFDGTLREVCPFGNSALQQVRALRGRQTALASALATTAWSRLATSTAPFATGLGNEHPIENGFAFLTPYGLPYLAGSGVKGVMRRAAEELVLEAPDSGWTWLDIWWLFGFEGAAGAVWDDGTDFGRAFKRDLPALAERDDLRQFIEASVTNVPERARYLDDKHDRRADFLQRLVSDKSWRQSVHMRGALDFWDVFPEPAENRQKRVEMVVEIMTPHQTGYYQGKETPHDAGQPTPVSFLALPAGSAFDFHIVCNESRLPASLASRWNELLDDAAAHAFDWLGFGAKTAVGYGAMSESGASRARRQSAKVSAQADAERALAAASEARMPPEERERLRNMTAIEAFRVDFETARKSAFNPGGTFGQKRNEFMTLALSWTDPISRVAAGELLRGTASKNWGTPGNKDAKQKLLDSVALLSGVGA